MNDGIFVRGISLNERHEGAGKEMGVDYLIATSTDIIEIPNLKVFEGLQVRHSSSGLSGTHLSPFVALVEWPIGSLVVHGLPMKIISFPMPFQSSTVKLIGRPSLSVFPVVQTKPAERYVFATIIYHFLWRIPLIHPSSDGFTRCHHRSRNQHGPKRRMRS